MNTVVLVALASAAFMFAIYVAVTLSCIERDIKRERDERRELRDEFWEHCRDAQAAYRALGLEKTPKKNPEWVVAAPRAKP